MKWLYTPANEGRKPLLAGLALEVHGLEEWGTPVQKAARGNAAFDPEAINPPALA